MLDQSVVTNDRGARKRMYKNYANALVQFNPQKFSIVPASQYIQGQDYLFRLGGAGFGDRSLLSYTRLNARARFG